MLYNSAFYASFLCDCSNSINSKLSTPKQIIIMCVIQLNDYTVQQFSVNIRSKSRCINVYLVATA